METGTLDYITYNFEFGKRIRAGFVGAGGHSFRNVLPTFQYAPVELVAVCDLDGHRASAVGKLFGAETSYVDLGQMLAEQDLDAVFIVTNYDAHGRPRATDLALQAIESGVHVWMEKPTASSVAEIKSLMSASERSRRFVMTGLKKMFFPSFVKVKELSELAEFGKPSSLYLRYPQSMPPLSDRGNLNNVKWLLDHIYHPAAIIVELLGPVGTLTYQWEPHSGGSISTFTFPSGAIAVLHMVGGGSGSSPLERLELVGQYANVVVENGVKVTYYRPANRPEYGRGGSYLVDQEDAPIFWEPEFSLGQLYNKNIFYLGYVPEVLHFCSSVLQNEPPTKGTLQQSLEIAKLFEAYCTIEPGVEVTIS